MNGTGHAEKNTKTSNPIEITTEAHETALSKNFKPKFPLFFHALLILGSILSFFDLVQKYILFNYFKKHQKSSVFY
jgi:hypothetical protein